MDNHNWEPSGSFFKPAPEGLNVEELAKRTERENTANHGFALVMSNGPAPSAEAVAFMQKYVDGEWSLQQVLDELLNHHGLDNPGPDTEPVKLKLAVPDEAASSVSDESGGNKKRE